MSQNVTNRPLPEEAPPAASSLGASTGPKKHPSTVTSRPILPGDSSGEIPAITGYTILEKLGQGGMGQVYKARQERLDRIVALKVIRQDRQDTEAVRRFQREARAAAKLSHPNIVIVHDFDQVGDNCFIAMEYVEGTDLYHLVKEHGPLDPALACDYARQVASGLQHAHERGLVHRDIKPANLLVAGVQLGASKPSESSPGVVKILDMGMALLQGVGKDSVHGTPDGGLMGTPDYMAPEQALDFRQVDIRADLYSLGCTFYYLLTGRPPFDEYPLMRKMMMHQQGTVRPVWELRSSIPQQIDVVVQKLLAKTPEHRYQTPAELVEALNELYPAPGDQGGKQVKAAAVPENFTSVSTMMSAVSADPPSSITSANAPSSIAPGRASRRRLVREGSAESGTPDRSPATPAEMREKEQPPPESAEPKAEPDAPKKLAVLQGPAGGSSALAFSPKRDLLAAGGLQGALRIWEFHGAPRQRMILQTFETGVWSVAFSPDQKSLAWGSGSLEGLVCLADLTDPTLNRMALLQRHQAPVDAVAFSADGKMLATGSRDQTVRWWDLNQTEEGLVEGKESTLFKGHKGEVTAVAFSPDSKSLASAGRDGTVRLWKRGGFWSKEKAVIDGKWGGVQSLSFAPLAPVLAFGCQDQTIRLFSLDGNACKEIAVLRGHEGAVRSVLIPPEGQTLISICDKGIAILWDLVTGSETRRWPLGDLTGAAFTVDGRYIALGSADGVVTVLRLVPRKSK